MGAHCPLHLMKKWHVQIVICMVWNYMWNKKSVRLENDYQTEWKIDMPEGKDGIYMNLWMKGTDGREVFSIKSPPNKAFKGNHGLPYEVGNEPYLTLAARQHGPAWENPFVCVYEPFSSSKGKSITKILVLRMKMIIRNLWVSW
ncbi:hypothetical protein [Zobellia alginiliquefaciens]|uniref:hypothetical protein n=1 Tax=Zobellia alginiliquefaciens TaxID=3032586 RepID=UPI0023E40E56|nr:hypothetical protein [Zobellia alginiliquefaciens]